MVGVVMVLKKAVVVVVAVLVVVKAVHRLAEASSASTRRDLAAWIPAAAELRFRLPGP